MVDWYGTQNKGILMTLENILSWAGFHLPDKSKGLSRQEIDKRRRNKHTVQTQK